MTGVWITIGALGLATAALKLAGPVILRGRPLRPRAVGIVGLLASALLAGLVVVETFGKNRSLTLDARALGVAFAVIVLARRGSLTVAVLGAAIVAAAARAIA
jgi:uncharacterized membrane protein